MKKCIILIIMTAVLLSSCNNAEGNFNLEFPDLTWGMTLDEVLESLDIEEDNIQHQESERGESIIIKDMDVFGEKASRVIMGFIDFTYSENFPEYQEGQEERNGLWKIDVEYSENTDMNRVLKKMKQAYGETTPEAYEFSSPGWLGDKMLTHLRKTSEDRKYWMNSCLSDCLPDTISDSEDERYRDLWKTYKGGLNDENWELFRENARLVFVVWADVETETGRSKGLSYDAYNLLVYDELKDYLTQ